MKTLDGFLNIIFPANFCPEEYKSAHPNFRGLKGLILSSPGSCPPKGNRTPSPPPLRRDKDFPVDVAKEKKRGATLGGGVLARSVGQT